MRTVEESIALIDKIVGRCIREPEFGRAVIDDPETALRDYQLNKEEMGDFLALRVKVGEDAISYWRDMKAAMFADRDS